MAQMPRISEAEWEIMKVLWAKKRCTAKEIIESLENTNNWSPKTIRSLINRLVQKQAIGFEKSTRLYIYYPIISEAECLHAETQSFLKRLYNGAFKPMLVNFIQEEKLTEKEIQELKNLLEEKRHNDV